MAKKIACIGTNIPGTDAESISLSSKSSLLDYDVVVINPDISVFYGYGYEEYNGRRCLDDSNSFRLKEHIEHWRREVLEAVKAGKNIFFMLNNKQEIYIATGEKSHSGTGRNRQTTRHVTGADNYEMIPANITATNSNGKSMSLVGNHNILAPYWKAVGSQSKFRILLDGKGIRQLIKTKTGNKAVGAILKDKSSDGSLVFLPYLDFDTDEFTFENEDDGKYYWTDEAVKLGKRFISSVLATDKALKSTGEMSAIPDWLIQDAFVLPKERKIRDKLVATESKIETLQKEKEAFEQQIAEESILKHLLYETGKPLENAIHLALETLGFSVSKYEDSESEFDVVFESKEGRLIGEAEGKDSKPINIDKLRQLEMNIHEDFSREDVEDIAKGALIGNAFRLTEPTERSDFFTDKCLTAANRSGTALISTVDLFIAAKYLSGKSDKKYAKACRESILSATGVVVFPTPPNEAKQETIIDNKNT